MREAFTHTTVFKATNSSGIESKGAQLILLVQ
jgi:hypothetical protein